ncbi:hypothetical protein BH20ACI3_BH20ACI3_31880 [soil metagenome]
MYCPQCGTESSSGAPVNDAMGRLRRDAPTKQSSQGDYLTAAKGLLMKKTNSGFAVCTKANSYHARAI